MTTTTDIRNHPFLINNPDSLIDLSSEELEYLLADLAARYLRTQADLFLNQKTDSSIDDKIAIDATIRYLSDALTDDDPALHFEQSLNDFLDELPLLTAGNCFSMHEITDSPFFLHINTLTEDELNDMIDNR